MSNVQDAEHSTILKSLTVIRQRLYTVRLAERAALALVVAGMVAVFLAGGRVLFGMFPVWGGLVTALPLIGAAWMWMMAGALGRPSGSLSRRAGINAGILRVTAILMAAAVVAAIAMLFAGTLKNVPLWPIPTGTAVLFLAAAALTVKPVEPKVAAIFVDQQVGLEERVSTSLEFLQSAPGSAMESAFRAPVIASAISACVKIRTAKVGYSRIDRRVYALAATVAIAAAGVSMLTPLVAKAGPAVRHYDVVVQKGATLAEKIKEMEATQKVEDPELKKKMAELRNIAESMKKGDMSSFEANKELSDLEKKIQEDQQNADKQADLEKAMEKSDELKDMKQASDGVKEAEQKTAGNNSPGSQEQREKAEAGVKKAAGELASKLNSMTDKDKKDLANELQKDSEKAKDPQVKQDLAEASKAAAAGDAQTMEQKLADAGSQMGQQGAQQQMSKEEAQKAMQQIEEAGGGKSAAEQESKPNGGEQGGDQGGGQQPQGGDQDGGQQPQGGDQGGGQQPQGGDQGGGSQPQGGTGNKPGQQQGPGGSSHAGQGSGEEQEGNGSTNLEQLGGPGDKHNGTPIGGTGTFVKVYDSKSIETRGKKESTPGHINPLGTPSGSVETMAKADDGDATIQSYDHVQAAAKKKALDDLSTQPIPPQDKDLIRAYYDK